MKFMLLIYGDEKGLQLRTREQAQKEMGAFFAYVQSMSEAGILQGGNPLAPSHQASTVRAVNGEMQLLDGPFSETKEQLGGYFIIDVASREEALAWAAKCPAAATGSVEVRAVVDPGPM